MANSLIRVKERIFLKNISKSGKTTPGVGYFYSGVAGGFKRGLEIGCFSLIDVQQNTAYHLESIQSPYKGKKKGEGEWTLIVHYLELLLERKNEFLGISNILVVMLNSLKKNMSIVFVTRL